MQMARRRRQGRELEATDGLWLALTAALTLAPHLVTLPIWLAGVTIVLLASRLMMDLGHLPPPRKGLLTLAGIAIFAMVGFHFHQLFGRGPGLALLSAFLCLKLLEARHLRDGYAVVLLSFFMQLGQFLQSQSISMGFLAVLGVFAAVATLTRLQGVRHPKPALRLAGQLLLQGLPLMLVLFVLFPRIEGPLWGMPGDAFSGTTGLSDSMQPGSISNLVRSGEIAFRAEFEDDIPPPRLRYWRGPVLTAFDGRTWLPGRHAEATAPDYRGSGKAYSYRMTLEPSNQRWLLALEVPTSGPPDASYASDFLLLSRAPVRNRIRFSATSHPDTRIGVAEHPERLRAALTLPAAGNPRARELGMQIRLSHADPGSRIGALLKHFRDSALIYTLAPPMLGTDTVDGFLFDTHRGFCEHFASAFVFTARAAEVPARVVTGYQGGEQNPLDGSIVVRQSDAHAWAEVWLAGRGWVRVDPTAESNPLRIDDGITAALSGEADLPFVIRADLDWLLAARHRWEAVGNAWNQWVLGYDPVRQRHLLGMLGMREANWQQLAAAIFALSSAVIAALLAWVYFRPRRGDTLDRSWEKLCAILRRRGIVRGVHEGPLDYTRRAAAARPEWASELEQIGGLYARLRYGPPAAQNPEARARLKQLINEIGKR